jgi:hypothetical protein
MDYRVDQDGTVAACDQERARRERLETRWWDVRYVAQRRQRLCRRHNRRCRQAEATMARARALRREISWPLW